MQFKSLFAAAVLLMPSLPVALGCNEYLFCVCDRGNDRFDNAATQVMCDQHQEGKIEIEEGTGRKVCAATDPHFINNCKFQNACEGAMGERGVSNCWDVYSGW